MAAVYEAITKITAALAKEGIPKERRNQQQGFFFRGIDDVYGALSPLLSEHHLCIIPRVVRRECVERQSKTGGVLFSVTVEVEFDLVSSLDDSRHTARVIGEAMDSGDKATNKAMSIAYKYLAFQVFVIPVEGEDADPDASSHEVASRRSQSDAPPVRHPAAPPVHRPAPAPAPPPAPRPAAGEQQVVDGTIVDIKRQSGTSRSGKAYLKYDVKMSDGNWYGTFDSGLFGESADAPHLLVGCRALVDFTLDPSGRYRNITGFVIVPREPGDDQESFPL